MLTRILLALLLVMPLRAAAQDPPPPDPLEGMPVRLGPLGLRPTVSFTNVGIDSNVFSDSENPQQDFTATIEPRLQARLRMGRLLLSYGSTTGFVYYRDFTDERSINASSEVRLDANLGRLQPYVHASWLDTKERMNAELDLRAPRRTVAYSGGTRLLLASRTALVVSARQTDIEFDQGVAFRGVELARTLNSRTNTIDGGLQLLLTPLTTLTMTVSSQRDRFDFAPDRDADSLRVVPTLQFDPTALIRGSVAVGYRRFNPRSDALDDYSGVVVDTRIGYTLLGRTRFDIEVQRDVHYSYEDDEPYYLTTGGRLTLTQQIGGPFDVQAIAGREWLAYRAAGADDETRRDDADVVGAGVGARLRENVRVGLNWELTRRSSVLTDREYERHRIFASLVYGS